MTYANYGGEDAVLQIHLLLAITSLIVKITISSIVIGLKALLFSTNSLTKSLSDSLLLDTLLLDSLLLDTLLLDSLLLDTLLLDGLLSDSSMGQSHSQL